MCGIWMGGEENCKEVGKDCSFDLELKRLKAFRDGWNVGNLKLASFAENNCTKSGLSDCQKLKENFYKHSKACRNICKIIIRIKVCVSTEQMIMKFPFY